MKRHHIETTTELARRLRRVGVSRCREQVWRIVRTLPRGISFTMLAGLCDVFKCGPGDILLLVDESTGRRRSEMPDVWFDE